MARSVDLRVGDALSFTVDQPPAFTQAARFIVFGFVGTPSPAERYSLPAGIGDLVLIPSLADPLDPRRFILATSFGSFGGAAYPGTTAPWSATLPAGISSPVVFTLQGVVEVGPGALQTSNAVRVSIIP